MHPCFDAKLFCWFHEPFRTRSAGKILAETDWFCERKYCFAGLINSEMSGGPAGWSEKFRPADGTEILSPYPGLHQL
jgi:hypothetical protein